MSADGFNVVIPARFASTRLPGKPLLKLAGRAMVVRVADQARASGAQRVVIATDDQRIADQVTAAGFDAEMTREDHVSGSDRVMEVVERLGWPPETIVVNVQGDEPLIPPAVIRQLGLAMAADPDLAAATLCEAFSAGEAAEDLFADPNVVKVVRGLEGQALYFSRAAVPHVHPSRGDLSAGWRWHKHAGIYGFRAHALARFVTLPASPLELVEGLEQLRLLENGITLKVFDACAEIPRGVDTPEDAERVAALLAES